MKNDRLESVHPSDVLLCEFLGLDRKTFNAFMNKKIPLNLSMANKFSKAFGVSAEFWLGLQFDYDKEQKLRWRIPKKALRHTKICL